MAELLALCAAFMFALAAALQQKGALGLEGVSLRSPGSFVRLAGQKFWLLGTAALLGGYLFQAVALSKGQLAIVQPLLVTTIVFALPLGHFLTQQAVDRRQIVAAGLVVVGLAVFTVVGNAAQGNDDAPSWEWAVAIVVLGTAAAVLAAIGGRGSLARKAGTYGACAGLLYGLSASLWKPTSASFSSGGLGGMLGNWELYAFAVAGILGFLVQQVSLATGRLAPSVAMTSVVNPLVSILIGTALLDERLAGPTWHKILAYTGLALALVAAMLITRAAEEARAPGPDLGPAGATATST